MEIIFELLSQVELEAAKSEIENWHSAFQNIPALPSGTNPDPVSVVSYLSNLKSSEESLKEQLEKAKKKGGRLYCNICKTGAGDCRTEVCS